MSKEETISLDTLRHSTAHVMAQAVKDLYGDVKLAIGPSIEEGFYYDFDAPVRFTEEDLEKIENRMHEIVREDLPFEREEMSKADAIEFFKNRGEPYKVELLEGMDDDIVTIYRQGDFVDLCRGPHVPSTGIIRAFKLLSLAGAYWRGDERNKMLQRIYGTAFFDKKSLRLYLNRLKEAKKRDHRKLGRKLDLFSINDEAGAGLVIWHPKGAELRRIIEDFEKREHTKRGYQLVVGPQILKLDLWKKSGHYENYRENMYFTKVDDTAYGIKPMNCLAHMLIYKSSIRSYRDLPIRYFELGTVHRHEKSGVLHGLMRVREFTQDDAHVLCRPDQLKSEIAGIIKFVDEVMGLFGFDYDMELSTRPEKSIGTDEDWEHATAALRETMEDMNLSYGINEGDGAFYGPKIDVKLRDVLGRRWQCATIQCDFALPERFDLTYRGEDGKSHRPVMLHRVILGALERFIGVLIEHYGGAFPVWLAPVQVRVMTITDRQVPFATEMLERLKEARIRVDSDFRNEKLGFKIREAQVNKIPYALVIGDREIEKRQVSPRVRGNQTLPSMEIEAFISRVMQECQVMGETIL